MKVYLALFSFGELRIIGIHATLNGAINHCQADSEKPLAWSLHEGGGATWYSSGAWLIEERELEP